MTGVYKEHDELREVSIGEELGVSRTPVREALRQLELEGLVTIVPNKGAYVTGITPQDVHDIYKIRSLLAVSYTHLDVYKRQCWMLPRDRMPCNRPGNSMKLQILRESY